jgi:hypothetical protein
MPRSGCGRLVEHREVFEEVAVGIAEVDGRGRYPTDTLGSVVSAAKKRQRRDPLRP